MSDDARDEFAAMRAHLDQAMRAVSDMAQLMASYFRALINESVPADTATALVLAYQEWLLTQGLDEGDE